MYRLVNSDDPFHHHTGLTRKPRKRNATFVLRLTSMIDVFTILLVFLLKNFSAEGQILSVSENLTLPVSSSIKDPKTTSVIMITTKWILVDGRPLETLQNVLNSDKLLIKNLYEDLRAKRILAESVAGLDERMEFRGEIPIQGDENIPFEILKRVMYTCGQVGYNDMLLAVTSNGE